jgi:pimeloyl-ACP methyl ester carboxylesterase
MKPMEETGEWRNKRIKDMALSITTLRGSTRLIFDCVAGISGTVEQMHETIARRPLPFASRPEQPTQAHGLIARSVYLSIRGINGALSKGVDYLMSHADEGYGDGGPGPEEVRWMTALNGVCGDYLESTGNPLALPMTLMTAEKQINLINGSLAEVPAASPDLLVMVHGLGCSEQNWSRQGNPDLGARLQEAFGYTPLYLRYNTGLHISTNGKELSGLLQRLYESWPVPVESLTLVGHSMGGLVIRSACWYADHHGDSWLKNLRRVLFLGTPHHGAPLEKAGHMVDVAMRSIQYVEPLAFGRHRSAGIKDLRHGNLLDEDWQGRDEDQLSTDSRQPVPLLPGVDYFFAAAIVGDDEASLKSRIMGDLLVRLGSATGAHPDEQRQLQVKNGNSRIFAEKHHFDLLDDSRVHDQVITWFRK